MFPRTSKVMLSVTDISRKCLCSGLSACVLMAVYVLFKLLSVSVLGTAAQIFFSAIQVVKAGLSVRHLRDGFEVK